MGKMKIEQLAGLLARVGINPAPASQPDAKPDFSAEYAAVDARLAELRVELRRGVRLLYAAQRRHEERMEPRGRYTRNWLDKIMSVMRPGYWYGVRDVRLRVWAAHGEDDGGGKKSLVGKMLAYGVEKGLLQRRLNPRVKGEWTPQASPRESKWIYALVDRPEGGKDPEPVSQ